MNEMERRRLGVRCRARLHQGLTEHSGPIKEMEMKNWTRMKVSVASEAKEKVCVVRNQAPSQITGSQLNVLPPVNFARIIY